MNIIACVKQVPDTEARIKIAEDRVSIDETDITMALNPFDEYAVEEALQLKEKFGGEVTVMSVGEEKAVTALRNCLAMGADKAVLIDDPAFAGSDPLAVAKILAAVIRSREYDLLLFGKQAVGEDHCQVGPLVAEILNLPHITSIIKLEINGQVAIAHREIEGATEVFECPLPAVLTAQKGLNEPRYASLKGIMMAKKKPVEILRLSDIGLSETDVGAEGAVLKVKALAPPPERSKGKVIEVEPAEAAAELAKFISDDAKLI